MTTQQVQLAPLAFSSFGFDNGRIATLGRDFPSYLSAWRGGRTTLAETDTHFGIAFEGSAMLQTPEVDKPIPEGFVFSQAGPAFIRGPGRGIVISREKWWGFNYILGPLEERGRLKYIDGCTDSLLIPPIRMGDPCLNLLYFPPGIDQTAHTHPSDRIGIILSGKGRCHYWDESTAWEEGLVDLVPGMPFAIHTNGKHKFSTPYGEPMRVLAYHPDSDFGPRDEDHPMLNRTIVEGVSAKNIDAIRTK